MTDRVLHTYIRASSILLADETGVVDWKRRLPTGAHVPDGIRAQIRSAQWDADDDAVCDVVLRAVQQSGQLINRKVRESFVRRCPRNARSYAAVFRAVFGGSVPDDLAFRQAAATLGANYDLIAFLFALRPSCFTAEDGEKIPYLPLRPARMEADLALLGFPLRLSKRCGWDNYVQYVLTVRRIRDALREAVGDRTDRPITTEDAFAFLWMTETLRQSVEEAEQIASVKARAALSAAALSGQAQPDDGAPRPKRSDDWAAKSILPPRDVHTAETALRRSCGLCEADARHKTFVRRNADTPFLEPHYLIPLCYADTFAYSLDHPANIVSLCSHCHDLLHYGRDAALLLTKLYDMRADALEEAGIGISCAELLRMYGIT